MLKNTPSSKQAHLGRSRLVVRTAVSQLVAPLANLALHRRTDNILRHLLSILFLEHLFAQLFSLFLVSRGFFPLSV